MTRLRIGGVNGRGGNSEAGAVGDSYFSLLSGDLKLRFREESLMSRGKAFRGLTPQEARDAHQRYFS